MSAPRERIEPTFAWTSGSLAARLGAELRGAPDLPLDRIDAIEQADERSLTFIRDQANAVKWASGRAGAALISRPVAEGIGEWIELPADGRRALLIVDDADLALISLLEEAAWRPAEPQGVHPSACIDPTAVVGQGVKIGANAGVGPRSVIGDASVVHGGVVIGADVRIGQRCVLHPGVVIQDRCSLGSDVILHPGVVIGADGFGYRPAPGGKGLRKIPHIGTVEIQDQVEIGANTTIDRGKFGATVIGAGTKIDNLVQIGHNCRIGRSCIICGCCALAGSVTLGDGVTLAGGVGIADQRVIGPGATIGARSGVMHDVPAGETWLGYPARPARRTMRSIAALEELPETLRQLRRVLKSEEPAG